MAYMAGAPRKPLSVRLEEETEIAPVRALAEIETEGNVSQMLRKLVREALAARQSSNRTPSKAGSSDDTRSGRRRAQSGAKDGA